MEDRISAYRAERAFGIVRDVDMQSEIRRYVRFGDASKEAVGHRLFLVRKGLGLTQQAMADILGTTQKNYQHIEKGKTYPQVIFIQNLLEAEGIDHNYVFGGNAGRLPSLLRDAIASRLPSDASD